MNIEHLYMAIALCVGSDRDFHGQCDYAAWQDSNNGLGYTKEGCLKHLNEMKERGNIVKLCLQLGSDMLGFHVEWDDRP
jgi:hypothetical protein